MFAVGLELNVGESHLVTEVNLMILLFITTH